MTDTLTWTRNGRRVTVARSETKRAPIWREEDHPRDREGKFIEKGARVRKWGGALATVVENLGGGRIEVQYDNGEHDIVHRNYLTVVQRPNGAPPTKEAAEAEAAPATGIPTRPDARVTPDPPSAANSEAVNQAALDLAAHLETAGGGETAQDVQTAVESYTEALDNGTPGDEADERAFLLHLLDGVEGQGADRGLVETLRAAATVEPDAPDTPDETTRSVPGGTNGPVDVSVGDGVTFTADGSERTGQVVGWTPNGGPVVRADGQDYPLLPDASRWQHQGAQGTGRDEWADDMNAAFPTRRRATVDPWERLANGGTTAPDEADEEPDTPDAGAALDAAREAVTGNAKRDVVDATSAYKRGDVRAALAILTLREGDSPEVDKALAALRTAPPPDREPSRPAPQPSKPTGRVRITDPAEQFRGISDDELRAERQQIRKKPGARSSTDQLRHQALSDELNRRVREGQPAADQPAGEGESFVALRRALTAEAIQPGLHSEAEHEASLARIDKLIADFQVAHGGDEHRNPFVQTPEGEARFRPIVAGVRLDSHDANATGTEDDPIYVGADIERAATLIAEGKHVRLNQPEQVSTLLDELARLSAEAEADGRDAVDFDLCQVSVEGTNLFCAEHQGIARVDMPQLKGIPTPGSPADLNGVKDRRGKVDIAPAFRQFLTDQGIAVEDGEVPAANLRATQREMSGPAVAAMIGAMRAGSLAPTRIFVTRDNYVVDGHHRWASTVALDAEDNRLGDTTMQVARIDLDVGAVIDLANRFSRDQGIPPKKRSGPDAVAASVGAQVAEAAEQGTATRFDIAGDPIPEAVVADLMGGSAEAHMVKTDTGWHFTPARLALHKRIMEDLLDGYEPSDDPVYNIMGGGPAAGKSTMEAQTPELSAGAVVLNADDIKAQLPEYGLREQAGDPTAASYSHEESSYLTKAIQREAFQRRINVTLDGTGNSTAESVRKKIAAARAAGYSVNGFYVTTDTDEAIRRATERGKKTGRVVPETVIRETHKSVSQVLPEVAGDLDSLVLYDTSNGLDEVARKDRGGELEVTDRALWGHFLAKADEDTSPTGAGAPEDRPGRFDIVGDPVPDDIATELMGGSAEAHLVKTSDGWHFTPARVALHQRIMEDVLDGAMPSEDPVFNIMGGGPAAGKSTMEAQTPELSAGAVVLNADDIKARLPEYAERMQRGDSTAAAFSHEESSYLTKAIQRLAFARKLNLTLDGTGDSTAAGVRKKIAAARAEGYRVRGYYVTASTGEAVRRANERGRKTGRFVPESVIRGTHKSVSQVLPEIVDDLDGLVLYDTENDLAEVVRKDEGGQLQVVDPDLWRKFLDKANEDDQAATAEEVTEFGVETEADRRRQAEEQARADRLSTEAEPVNA